jgi:hypothetical protein
VSDTWEYSRRDALAGLLAGFAAPAAALAARPGTSTHADAESVARLDPLTTYVRLRASLAPQVAIWYVRDVRYGLAGREVTPMYGIEVGVFMEAERRSESEFSLRMIEATYKTDLRTGELLESYTNPYTGRTVPVKQWEPRAEEFFVTADTVRRKHAPPTLATADVRLSRPLLVGPDVQVDESSRWVGHVPAGEPEAPILYEWARFSAPLAQVLDPAVPACDTRVAAMGLGTFQGWLDMAGHSGTQLMHGTGYKALRVEDLPRSYLRWAEKRNPEILDDPRRAVRGR